MARGREGNRESEVSLKLRKGSISRGQQWPTELKNTTGKGQQKAHGEIHDLVHLTLDIGKTVSDNEHNNSLWRIIKICLLRLSLPPDPMPFGSQDRGKQRRGPTEVQGSEVHGKAGFGGRHQGINSDFKLPTLEDSFISLSLSFFIYKVSITT